MGPADITGLNKGAVAEGLTAEALVFALPRLARPRERGRSRLLQGSSSSSMLASVLAVACTRFAGRSCGRTSPENSNVKGMFRPAGKQL